MFLSRKMPVNHNSVQKLCQLHFSAMCRVFYSQDKGIKKMTFLFPVESQNTLKALSGIGRMSIINKFKAFPSSSYSLYFLKKSLTCMFHRGKGT